MNWLLILVVVLLLGNAFWGYKKGLLRVAFSLVSWVLVLAICHFATPVIVDFVIENTDIVTVMQDKITEKLNETLDESAYAGLEAAIPEEIKQMLAVKMEDLAPNMGAGSNGNTAIDLLLDSTGIVYTILFFVISVAVALAARLIVQVVDMVLGIASKLPLIGSVDKILGTVLGAAKGLVWCWLVLAVVTVLALTGTNTEFIGMIQQSEILTWLNDNNMIVNVVLKSIPL